MCAKRDARFFLSVWVKYCTVNIISKVMAQSRAACWCEVKICNSMMELNAPWEIQFHPGCRSVIPHSMCKLSGVQPPATHRRDLWAMFCVSVSGRYAHPHAQYPSCWNRSFHVIWSTTNVGIYSVCDKFTCCALWTCAKKFSNMLHICRVEVGQQVRAVHLRS